LAARRETKRGGGGMGKRRGYVMASPGDLANRKTTSVFLRSEIREFARPSGGAPTQKNLRQDKGS